MQQLGQKWGSNGAKKKGLTNSAKKCILVYSSEFLLYYNWAPEMAENQISHIPK